MRFVVCAQIWHCFDVLHRHLLLMMDFDYPLAFRHKKGEYIFDLREHFVLFSREEHFIFVGQSLWSCLDCIQVLHIVLYFFSSCHICFVFDWDIHVRRSIFFFALYVSCFNYLLIYVFIVCCLKSRIYFICLYFPHMRLYILFKCFRKYVG